MRVSPVFRHPWPLAASRLLLAASLLLPASVLPAASALPARGVPAGAAVQAVRAARVPNPPESAGGNPTHLSHGRFKDFLIYKPSGSPTSFVLLLSGDEAFNSTPDAMPRQLPHHST